MIFTGLMLWLLSAAPGLAQCTTGGSVIQWRCWEQTIVSGTDFYNNGAGNPYKDLILRVTFTNAATSTTFTQDAFWVADTANPKNFKVRVALPAAGTQSATWTWQVASCTKTVDGQPCGGTWTPSSGTITVTSSTSGPQIYARGFPNQLRAITPLFIRYTPILYADLVTRFLWAADTAWSAPGLEASGQTNLWGSKSVVGSYIYNRNSKKINVLLVAPAATYQPWPWSTGTKPFVPDSCSQTPTAPIPNDCSRPNPAYWNNFDTLVSNANQADIVPLIAGLIDPLDTGTNLHYPHQTNAVAFSRFLAARMAGFAVFFSPGFDDRINLSTWSDATHPVASLQTVMNAVGSALKQAAPQHLVTNHLGGKQTCSDYQAFRNASWMNFFLFQSSHGIGLPTSPDPVGTICPIAVSSTETSVQAALRRSWQMPWTLTSSSASPPLPSYDPIKPSYNGEGPYDNICLQTPGCTCPATNPPGWCRSYDSTYTDNFGAKYVDVRYHNRQAAFESLLSGAYGFTYGSQEIAHWYFNLIPFSSALTGTAVNDMTSVFQNFNTRAGMDPHRDWITNNGSDTANDGDRKKALSTDYSTLVLAYVPAGTTDGTIAISTSSLPSLACSGTGWTYTWQHAQNSSIVSGSFGCSGTNPIRVTSPPVTNCPAPTYHSQACDWVLQIQKTGAASLQSQQAVSGQTLDVWTDLSPQDGTSAIYANLIGAEVGQKDAPVLVSPPGFAFQQSPRVTRLRDGYLVVWHADSLDGGLLGVFAQRLDRTGQPVGNRIQVNTTTEHDQRDPAVDSDPLGNTVIAWSSYGQDGDLGAIYGRVFDSGGQPVTAEFQINSEPEGHQETPQVAYLPGGNFVIAWPTRSMGDAPGALSFRIFSRNGDALTNEIAIPGQVGVNSRLVDVAATPAGGLRVRWGLYSLDGDRVGLFAQEFNALGNALSPPSALP
jgi:hypothetical protein